MKVDIQNVGSYSRKIAISVPADTVRKELDTAYRTLQKRSRLRGFRPGKAPRKVLEARYGAEVNRDVANDLIQQSYTKAISEHELEPVSRPQLEENGELSAGDDFSFSILVDVKPSVAIETYTGVEVEFPKVDVDDEELDRNVSARLEGHARLVEVERPVEAGDMVLVELTATDGEDEVAKEPGTMIRTESDPYYPGIESVLVGMKKDEEKTETVTFSEEARNEDIAGKELSVAVKVLSVQANEVPELDDDLAEELGFEGGAEGMRNAVRQEILDARTDFARNQARANLLQVLIDSNEFEVPQGMIDQNLQLLMEELRLQQAYRGKDPRNVHFSEEQIADLRTRAEFATKAGLILEYVTETEKIEVTDEDLENKYQELADQRGQTVEAVKGWFQKDDAVDELNSRLLEEKTLDWLLERAELVEPKEKPVPSAAEVAEAAAAEASEE